jgi:hypothetical protein
MPQLEATDTHQTPVTLMICLTALVAPLVIFSCLRFFDPTPDSLEKAPGPFPDRRSGPCFPLGATCYGKLMLTLTTADSSLPPLESQLTSGAIDTSLPRVTLFDAIIPLI